MGTTFSIRVYAESQTEVTPAIAKAWRLAQNLDLTFSDYKAESELNRLCRESEGNPVKISPPFAELLNEASHFYQATSGDFDITLGPLKRLWILARRDQRLPTSKEIEQARVLTGFDKLISQNGEACLPPGMQLDLGGIAKGYAADRLLALLNQEGFPRALVAASGDLAIGSAPPGRKGWEIELRSASSPDKTDKIIYLKNVGVSTSGDSQQFVEIKGQRYSHILDPDTGLGLTRRRSVTVVAPTCTQSDAWATALSVAKSDSTWLENLPPTLSFRLVEEGADGFSEKVEGAAFILN